MTIQIENSGASIKVTENGESFYIAKPYTVYFIPTVTQPGNDVNSGVRPGTIVIKYPDGSESKDFSFVWSDCTLPVAADIQALVDAIAAFNTVAPSGVQDVRIVAPIGQTDMAGSVPVTMASDQTSITVKPLLAQGTGRTLTTTASSANTALTAGIKGVSIYARNSDAYYSIGNSSQTASSTKGFIAQGERLDLDVSSYPTPNIAVIFGPSAAAAILQVTELV